LIVHCTIVALFILVQQTIKKIVISSWNKKIWYVWPACCTWLLKDVLPRTSCYNIFNNKMGRDNSFVLECTTSLNFS
jgi:beta-lactamase regulating signal transducer with metallopeptidase domain